MRPQVSTVLLVLLMTLPIAGCGSTAATVAGECSMEVPLTSDAHESLALVLSKAVARAGDHVIMSVESTTDGTEAVAGANSAIECWDGAAWVTKYVFIVNAEGISEAHAYPVKSSEGHTGSGFVLPKPAAVQLPVDMPPGRYRIRKQISVGPSNTYTPATLYASVEIIR